MFGDIDVLTEQIRAIEATLRGGSLGVCAAGSATRDTVSYNADWTFPTASVIKAPIVAEMWAQILEGKLSPYDTVTINAEDFIAGSGVLITLEPGHTFTIDELARLAISVSDNTASNALLRVVGGPDVVNRRMQEEWRMTGTRIHRPIKFHLEPGDPPHTATGTPADMLRFMDAVATGTLHSPEVSGQMMTVLEGCQDTSMIPRYLEVNVYANDLETDAPAFTVHHKTGGVTGVRHDAGIVRRSAPPFGHVALAIFTKGCTDTRWTAANFGNEAVARVAKLLTHHLLN